MRRRMPWLLLLPIGIGLLLLVVLRIRQGAEAQRLFEAGEARLRAPLARAPELDRIQASTARSMLERAEERGCAEVELQPLLREARALEQLQRGDLVFARAELEGASRFRGWSPALRVLAAEIARRSGDLEAARFELDEALLLDAEHPRALQVSADLYL
ncbi:MAG: hypothetical protein OEY14_13495, partial [Myxococcales bacterium]|nr:hypothetical protein [Myxococcales bacterium]